MRGRVAWWRDRRSEAVVSNLDEAWRQHVLDEAREQLVGGDGDGFAVLGAEGDAAIIPRDQALIGNADAVSVATEITNDLVGSTEGALGVDDPGLAVKRANIDVAEVDLAVCVGALEGGEHLAAKERAHDAHGEEESTASANEARAIVGESTSSDDGVYVRMKQELAGPSVQDHRDTELGAEALRIAGEREQRRRRAGEQHVEDRLA